MNNEKKDTRWLTSVALMMAIVILLANTPLGMIQLPIIKATTVHIPVIIGAILLGPAAGAILGARYGSSGIPRHWLEKTRYPSGTCLKFTKGIDIFDYAEKLAELVC